MSNRCLTHLFFLLLITLFLNFYILIIVDDSDVIKIKYNDREKTGEERYVESLHNDNITINNFVAESETRDDDNHLHFPSCNLSDTPSSSYSSSYKCLNIKFPIYSKASHKLLLIPRRNQQRNLLPNSDAIPYHEKFGGLGYCGFGKLLFDEQTMEWTCHCMANEYFGGETCDEPQPKMIRENKCLKVVHISDKVIDDNLSLFNPFIDGMCVQCVSPETQVPLVNVQGGGMGPVCKDIHEQEEENGDKKTDEGEMIRNHPCKYDALNPHLYNSPNNYYDPKYGCVCDYHNGFVEAILLSSPKKQEQVL